MKKSATSLSGIPPKAETIAKHIVPSEVRSYPCGCRVVVYHQFDFAEDGTAYVKSSITVK